MKNWMFFLSTILVFSIEGFSQNIADGQSLWSFDKLESNNKTVAANNENNEKAATKNRALPKTCHNPVGPDGWSFDLGGQYTWMSLTTPPTFTGSTGGANGKITYQRPKEFFGQLRSVYNNGSLSSSLTNSNDNEWYTEIIGGYCFCISPRWTITPYTGVGLDFLNDHKKPTSTLSGIHLHYRTSYAVFGFDTHYSWDNWYLGLQADCLPVFHQYLRIGGLAGAAWTMSQKVGAAARIPVAYKLTKGIWLELAPYYRYMPIGSSPVLDLPMRIVNEVGAFLTFRFFI